MCMCTRTYTYAYTYTRAPAQARDPVIINDDSPIDQRQEQAMYLVLVFGLLGSLACLLRARAREPNRPKTRTRYIAQSPDDSGSKLRDKEQQRLSSK